MLNFHFNQLTLLRISTCLILIKIKEVEMNTLLGKKKV